MFLCAIFQCYSWHVLYRWFRHVYKPNVKVNQTSMRFISRSLFVACFWWKWQPRHVATGAMANYAVYAVVHKHGYQLKYSKFHHKEGWKTWKNNGSLAHLLFQWERLPLFHPGFWPVFRINSSIQFIWDWHSTCQITVSVTQWRNNENGICFKELLFSKCSNPSLL